MKEIEREKKRKDLKDMRRKNWAWKRLKELRKAIDNWISKENNENLRNMIKIAKVWKILDSNKIALKKWRSMIPVKKN